MSDTISPKAELSKSESWVTIVAVLGSIAPMLSAGEAKWVSLAAAVIAAAAYAYFHTSLPSEPLGKAGWKTPGFWAAIATIGGSIAVVLTDTSFSFLPAGVTRIAAIVVTAATAAGYTLYRYTVKQAIAAVPPAPVAPPVMTDETPTPPSVPKRAA
jgi:hypothetical protein